jgi:hypothetical protein
MRGWSRGAQRKRYLVVSEKSHIPTEFFTFVLDDSIETILAA